MLLSVISDSPADWLCVDVWEESNPAFFLQVNLTDVASRHGYQTFFRLLQVRQMFSRCCLLTQSTLTDVLLCCRTQVYWTR